MHYRDVFDSLASVYSLGEFSSEYQLAREEYFGKVGKLFEDDAFFESRINAFLEWYLIDRIYQPLGVPFIRRERLMNQTDLRFEQIEMYKSLEHSKHSSYLVKSVGSSSVKLQNLLGGEPIELKKVSEYVSLQEGDIIDARTFVSQKEIHLTQSFWHHPRESNDLIIKISQSPDVLETNPDLMLSLAQMRWKRETFPHVPIEQLYTLTPKGLNHAQTNRP